MNEEKNNIGAQNIGASNNLPQMGNVSSKNASTGNTNVNNLPPMGSIPSVAQPNTNSGNIQDKYGLPPISNFTNFNNSYKVPKVDDNTSVFDLMDQFDSVNNHNLVNNSNNTVVSGGEQVFNNNTNPNLNNSFVSNEQTQQISSIQNVNNNQGMSAVNILQPEINSVPNIPEGSVTNNNVENVFIPSIPILNQSEVNNDNVEPLNMFSGNNDSLNTAQMQDINVDVDNQVDNSVVTSIPTLNNVQNDTNNSVIDSTKGFSDIPFNNLNMEYNNNNINNNINGKTLNGNPTDIVNDVENVVTTSSVTNNSAISNVDNTINTLDDNSNQVEQDNNFDEENNRQSDLNNASTVVEIPTVSIDNVDNTSNDSVDELITTFDNNATNLNTDNKKNANNNNNKQKKKKSKLIFIILLIVTILIVAMACVLSYFMFFKNDKLVCGYQDYSNEQYILDESMVFRFKGNKMTDAKLSQVLTFTEDNLDKKDSYLEELKNQYQGLGFNVAFVENEDGFEIDMDFTKSELESWYGTNLKNSSKNQMKKEMRDSGYTCK